MGGGVDFPECITDHMTSGRGLHPGGGGLLPREEICIQREKWFASRGGTGLHRGGGGLRFCIQGRGGLHPVELGSSLPELGKRTVHILLEYFLVFIVNNCLLHSVISRYECKQTTFNYIFSTHTH